jgi:hypothetical protein
MADMANDFVMSLGAHWVQSDGESFFEAVGTEVDLGPKELSDQGAGVALYINRRLWPFTALNSWTGSVSTGCNSRTELHLNRRHTPSLCNRRFKCNDYCI